MAARILWDMKRKCWNSLNRAADFRAYLANQLTGPVFAAEDGG